MNGHLLKMKNIYLSGQWNKTNAHYLHYSFDTIFHTLPRLDLGNRYGKRMKVSKCALLSYYIAYIAHIFIIK